MALEVSQYIQQMNSTMYADTDKMEFYIELATPMCSVKWFKTMLNYAIALRAMHMYTLDTGRPDGEAGLITGKSEGNTSIRYWNKVEKGRYSDLQMTHWGQRLLALIKSRGPTISVAHDPYGVLANLTIDNGD